MSTSSIIAMYEKVDGIVQYRCITCHFDGYPKYMGNMLRNHYSEPERVSELISHGCSSSISERINPISSTHSFDEPEEGCCVFYHRDRGDDWEAEAPFTKTDSEFINFIINSFHDYTYVYKREKWYLATIRYDADNKKHLKLTGLNDKICSRRPY